MVLNVEGAVAGFNPERRRKIEERAAGLIAEEIMLREACRLAQDGVVSTRCCRRCAERWRRWAAPVSCPSPTFPAAPGGTGRHCWAPDRQPTPACLFLARIRLSRGGWKLDPQSSLNRGSHRCPPQ